MAHPTVDVIEIFGIDADAATHPFQQVHDAVVSAVSDGRITPGTKLPTVRALAAHLGIAVNTVASAYRELEATGVVEGRGRAGTFVKLSATGNPVEAEARRIAIDAARGFARLGLNRERSHELLDDALGALAD